MFSVFSLANIWAKNFDTCKDQGACRIAKKIHLWCHFWNIKNLLGESVGHGNVMIFEILRETISFNAIYPGTEKLGSIKKIFSTLVVPFSFQFIFFFQFPFNRSLLGWRYILNQTKQGQKWLIWLRKYWSTAQNLTEENQ